MASAAKPTLDSLRHLADILEDQLPHVRALEQLARGYMRGRGPDADRTPVGEYCWRVFRLRALSDDLLSVAEALARDEQMLTTIHAGSAVETK
jgi:hypothetical protein